MNLFKNNLRSFLLIAIVGSIAVYVSCKGKIEEPIGPEYVPPSPPPPPIPTVPADTGKIKPPKEIELEQGSLNNKSLEDLAENGIANKADSMELANTATALAEIWENDMQEAYWVAITRDQIIDRTRNRQTAHLDQQQKTKLAFDLREALKKYLPEVVLPSTGRTPIEANGASSAEMFSVNDNSRITSNLCITTWTKWRDGHIASLRAVLDAALAKINVAYNRQKSKLDESKGTAENSISNNLEAQVNRFGTTYDNVETKLEEALDARNATQETYRLAQLLNKIVLSLNIDAAILNSVRALQSVTQQYETSLGTLDASKKELDDDARGVYNNAAQEIQAEYQAELEKCTEHDQGGTSS